MKRTLAAFLFSALAACGGETQTPAPESTAAETPEPEPQARPMTRSIAPALQYKERTLANGLRVYSMPSDDTSTVSVHVWYQVGSKDDPPGRSGFAHLFEHIMFKTTRNMPAETLDRLTEDVGGFNNASTGDDYTNYYEVAPAHHLERLLWAEAERMGSLVVDEEIFDSERDVVIEELRQRVLASPYGRLFYLYLAQANYSVHPYGRPGIGSIEDLEASTVADVRAFHAAYYRPDNAVLVVAGNYDEADLDRWVDKYFAPIPTPDRPIPKTDAVEPSRTEARTLTAYAPNVPLPAVMASWPGLDASDPDLAALMVLDAILARGESSRLYQSVVYETQTAAEAFTYFHATRDPSVYVVAAILSAGKTVEEGSAALAAVVESLRAAPVSAAELEEAKNEIVTEKLEGRETAYGRAYELADSVSAHGDAAYADKLLADVQNVTAEDVLRVAQRIFVDAAKVEVRYLDEGEKPAGAAGDAIVSAPTIIATPVDVPAEEIPVWTLAPEATRVQPPAPGAPVAATPPKSVARSLPNGMKVIVARKTGVPLVSANLRFAAGLEDEPADLAGLAEMTATLAMKGTTTRSAGDIAREIEALGAQISTGAGPDSAVASLLTRADRAGAAFDILADIARNPVFAAEELERVRQQSVDELSVALSEPSSIASRAMSRAMFGDLYGAVATDRSLKAIARENAADYHAQVWRPDNAVLVIAGDIAPDAAFRLAEDAFGDWRAAERAPSDASYLAAAAAPRHVAIDLPGVGQAAVAFGASGLPRIHPDYYKALVATQVLGGGYSARLNREIRIKRGLSYGASARLAANRYAGQIYASAQTRNDAAVEVATLMEAEFKALSNAGLDAAELEARKAGLIGGFGRNVETTAGVAGQISSLALFGLSPDDELAAYVDRVSSVSAEDVAAAAARLMDPASAMVIAVGDAKVFWKEFKAKYPDAERISVDDLNLDDPALK